MFVYEMAQDFIYHPLEIFLDVFNAALEVILSKDTLWCVLLELIHLILDTGEKCE